MDERNCMSLLRAKWSEGKHVCVGLDSDIDQIPKSESRPLDSDMITDFNYKIINTTNELVCAYKLNLAFYIANGIQGMEALYNTIQIIHKISASVPVILDAKVGDVPHTNEKYAKMAFDSLEADGLTVIPYCGGEALKPFFSRQNKGIFIVCRTSNPGSDVFQSQIVMGDSVPKGYMHLYRYVAEKAQDWNQNKNIGLVVGATQPDELSWVNRQARDLPILIPGIGSQGADLHRTLCAVKRGSGKNFLINSSRSIIFASDQENFASIAREQTEILHNAITEYFAQD